MAKLADALALGASESNLMRVQVPPRPPVEQDTLRCSTGVGEIRFPMSHRGPGHQASLKLRLAYAMRRLSEVWIKSLFIYPNRSLRAEALAKVGSLVYVVC